MAPHAYCYSAAAEQGGIDRAEEPSRNRRRFAGAGHRSRGRIGQACHQGHRADRHRRARVQHLAQGREREARQPARSGRLHDHDHGQLRRPQLPPDRSGCRQGDEPRQHGPGPAREDHVGRHARERRLQVQVRRPPLADEGQLPRRPRAASSAEADREGRPRQDDHAQEGRSCRQVARRRHLQGGRQGRDEEGQLPPRRPRREQEDGRPRQGQRHLDGQVQGRQGLLPLGRLEEAQAGVQGRRAARDAVS